ncbi:Arginine_deiminase [Hexamita inflata]|uniref:Arginine deiminase n=1 Tax=Hexamita inflata TaxID=28002 RepID=A0AA86UJ43_9EUKA|nr:Arginine deiminase [Hexamita inflata]
MSVTPVAFLKPRQAAEDERAKSILVFRPEMAVFVNCLHAAGSLYECPISAEFAEQQHLEYQRKLESFGIDVYNVSDVLIKGCEDPKVLDELRNFAGTCLSYNLPENQSHIFASEDYKHKTLIKLSAGELVKVILTNPTIHLMLDNRNTGIITQKVEMEPMGNCVFTRDQQITTKNGVVMCNFAASQRAKEAKILEFTLKKLNINPIGRIHDVPEATMEGGDFVILTQDTCALGIGLRSSYSAGQYMMQNDLLGFKRFLMVKDVFDQHQDRMHLDCTFSPIHQKLAVIDQEILKKDKLRYVDEFIRLDKYDPVRKSWYRLNRANVEFGAFLEGEGYSLIKLPHEYQLAYGCNMLNLGCINGHYKVLTVHNDSRDYIMNSPEFKKYCEVNKVNIDVEYVEFRAITSMYGSLHCASQVLERFSFEEDKIVREADKIQQVEPEFDYVIEVPTFCNRDDLVQEAQNKYNELIASGKTVYLVNKYWIGHFVSLKNANVKSVEEVLQLLRKEDLAVQDMSKLDLNDCMLKLK